MSLNINDLCLGALSQGEASGYDIRKLFEEGGCSHFMAAGYGSIYPALTRLTEQGLIECRTEAQDKRPDRKVYSITDAGRAAFQGSLCQAPARDSFRSEFVFMMMYAHLLPRKRVRQLIDERIAFFERSLGEFHEKLGNPDSGPLCEETRRGSGVEFALRNGIAVCQAEVRFLTENRHLVEDRAMETETIAAQ